MAMALPLLPPPPPPPPSRPALSLSPTFYYATLCVIGGTTCGGFLAGCGPLLNALIDEGYADDFGPLAVIPIGAANIMTVATCLAGIALPLVGPRVTSCTGMAVAIGGNVILASSTESSSSLILLLAFGMVIGGGNASWLAFFPSSSLFQEPAMPTSFMAAMWPIAGLMYIFLAIEGVTVNGLTATFGIYECVVLVYLALYLPDRPHKFGDVLAPNIRCPPCFRLRGVCGVCGVRGVCGASSHGGGGGCSGSQSAKRGVGGQNQGQNQGQGQGCGNGGGDGGDRLPLIDPLVRGVGEGEGE
eukprot:CAMPEP_0119542340 /NCGR_PEP_ID=MMETSP1344-20130328/53523_1 /TAXON_ID=236787 /ORGANISM="Florenciella parvula, Strain CCMP2471" /LENGTH=300 /DNA_ID=CAMNT_0007586537 /DNA_START=255 /DNA_END=1154 /DNA_ORIENTATION=-